MQELRSHNGIIMAKSFQLLARVPAPWDGGLMPLLNSFVKRFLSVLQGKPNNSKL